MELVLDTLISGFPYFISHFGLTLIMLGAGVYIYQKVTPYDELELVRKGNVAASISLAAGILGLAIPLASCLEGSVSLWDIVIWGWVILIIQILAFFFANLVIDDLKEIATEGSGFYTYIQNSKPDTLLATKKISYVKGFNNWQWIVGTGFYEDDILTGSKSVLNTIK